MSGRSRGRMRVGLVGCGNISAQYLDGIARLDNLELASVTDAVPSAAQRVADSRDVPVRTLDEMLVDDGVDVVLNLTPPQLHAPLSMRALEAGKHVYQEKPFALGMADAEELLASSRVADSRLGCAPDTVLGPGIQTARRLIDDGEIGTPVAASAFFVSAGHESWHPNPAFYYLAGGGPLLDMGVYYLTALVTMLGPIRTVTAMGSRMRGTRRVPAGAPRAGDVLTVEVDTHVAAILHHDSGVISTLGTSFDVRASRLPRLEIYGTEGTVAAPDPNTFDESPELSHYGGSGFTEVAATAGYPDAGRGVGLSEMVTAIQSGEPHRQSAELGFHVHEVMMSILDSASHGKTHAVHSDCTRPAPAPLSNDVPAAPSAETASAGR